MKIIAAVRNALKIAAYDLGRVDGASAPAVVLINPDTGNAFGGSSNPIPVSNPINTVVSGPAGQFTINENLLTGNIGDWLDVSGYHSGSVQIIASAGISAGAIIFEQTNDITAAPNGAAMGVIEPSVSMAAGSQLFAATTIAASSVRIFSFPINAKYIRCRISTAFVGGSVQAIAMLSQMPFATPNGGVYAVLPSTQGLGTVTTVSTVTTLTGGATAEDAATTSSPLIVGGVVRTAVAPTTLIAGDAVRATLTSGAALVVKPYAVPETDWQYTGTLTTTTAAAAKAAGAASIRNYVTGVQFQNTGATASTVLIQDGATTIAQFNAPANMVAPAVIPFNTPLKGTAATALNVNCGTAGANILINVQGYQAA